MHLTLDALVVLDAIVRGGSFARAAELLNRVPSAVSYSVQKLEHELGVTIFDRSGHRARLTEAGMQLLEEGRELLERAHEIERRVRRVHAGWRRLRIFLGDMVVTSGIYPILTKFHAMPEHRPTELCMEVGPQRMCWERLASGQCDVAIGAPALGSTDDAYDVQPLGAVHLTLAISRSHPLAREAEPVPNQALAPHRIVRQATWAFGASPELHGAEYVTVTDSSSQVDAIRHGLGVGYVPWHLVQDDVASGRLVTRAVVQPPQLLLVVASRRRERTQGSPLSWFLAERGDEEVRSRFVPRADTADRFRKRTPSGESIAISDARDGALLSLSGPRAHAR